MMPEPYIQGQPHECLRCPAGDDCPNVCAQCHDEVVFDLSEDGLFLAALNDSARRYAPLALAAAESRGWRNAIAALRAEADERGALAEFHWAADFLDASSTPSGDSET